MAGGHRKAQIQNVSITVWNSSRHHCLDHCIRLPEQIERGWYVALPENLPPFPGNSTVCYPLSSYGVPCTDMDILTIWSELRLPTPLCVLKFWGLNGLDSMCRTSLLSVFQCLSHREGQHDMVGRWLLWIQPWLHHILLKWPRAGNVTSLSFYTLVCKDNSQGFGINNLM